MLDIKSLVHLQGICQVIDESPAVRATRGGEGWEGSLGYPAWLCPMQVPCVFCLRLTEG